jgi:phosphonate transport system ATP-binding protein
VNVAVIQISKEDIGFKDEVVLRDVRLCVSHGERLAIVGASGAGKSTLLRYLKEIVPDAALVPQDMGLVKNLTVFHNVFMGRLDQHSTWYNLGNLIYPKEEKIAEIRALLRLLGLEDKIFERVGTLSGGQQLRTSVCRAIYQGGSLVLADEPVSSIDSRQSVDVMEILTSRFDSCIFALHDVGLALRYASRIIGLRDGEIALDSQAADLHPEDLQFLYAPDKQR